MEGISYSRMSAKVLESLRQDYSQTFEDIRGLTQTSKSPRYLNKLCKKKQENIID